MLRNEVEMLTGLTRKALEYYENKGLFCTKRDENGYRRYSREDIDRIRSIGLYRRLGLSVEEIKAILRSDTKSILGSIVREKHLKNEIERKKEEALSALLRGEELNVIEDRLKNIEQEETVYQKLTRVFPGYFGQLFFFNYKPFLSDKLDEKGKAAFDRYVKFMDGLPPLCLSKEEVDFLEKGAEGMEVENMTFSINERIGDLEEIEDWCEQHDEEIRTYLEFQESDEYRDSLWYSIKKKLENYMAQINYFEIALPLIREFSPSYDRYYKTMLKANEHFVQKYRIERRR